MEAKALSYFTEDIPLQLHRLKQRLKKEHRLSWGQYLILCAVKKIDRERYFVTTREVEEELQMNRCWVYKCVRVLAEGGLLAIDTTDKPWEPNFLALTIYGETLLRRAGRELEGV